MIKLAIVILHYLTLEDTIECVNSFFSKLDIDDYKIVIVDNASPNNTGKQLSNIYANNNRIHIILSKVNLGFAKGNNLGFEYSKNILNAEYIILSNNDILLVSKNLYQETKSLFDTYHYSVLGPLILSANCRCDSNPVGNYLLTEKDLDKLVRHYKRQIRLLKRHMYSLYSIYNFAKKKIRKAKVAETNNNYIRINENVKLHGAFMIFSPSYITMFNGLDDRTFMYMEEDILYRQMLSLEHKTLYSPNIIVFHKEGIATKYSSKDDISQINKYKRLIDSCSIMRSIINEFTINRNEC